MPRLVYQTPLYCADVFKQPVGFVVSPHGKLVIYHNSQLKKFSGQRRMGLMLCYDAWRCNALLAIVDECSSNVLR